MNYENGKFYDVENLNGEKIKIYDPNHNNWFRKGLICAAIGHNDKTNEVLGIPFNKVLYRSIISELAHAKKYLKSLDFTDNEKINKNLNTIADVYLHFNFSEETKNNMKEMLVKFLFKNLNINEKEKVIQRLPAKAGRFDYG